MNGTAYGPDLTLSPDQEGLLQTALSSNKRTLPDINNKRQDSGGRPDIQSQQALPYNATISNGANMNASPIQAAPGSGQFEGLDQSPFLDYDIDDGNFDWEANGDQLFGDLPGGEEDEHHEKRKASLDDEDEEEGSSKRREGDEKSAKKPGRKPLTAEPTTKRKAQNRAAQRAFRERKERHLKDLETKVDDLEKASEATNHENGRLRAQVQKLNSELKEYRRRISSTYSTGASASPPQSATAPRNYQNDFSFAFPKFGDLPSTGFLYNGSTAKTTSPPQIGLRSASSSNPSLPAVTRKESSGSASAKSPINANGGFTSPLGDSRPYQASTNGFNNPISPSANLNDLTGLFSPSILETASRSNSTDYLSYNGGGSTVSTTKPTSFNSMNGQPLMPPVQRGSSASMTASPTSSMSQNGLDSSCGTTPEASSDSPDNRKASESMLNTINEESNAFLQPHAQEPLVKSPAAEINGIDWLAQQNGGQFDPVLFGDYRDPQDSILNNAFGDFFNDAFPAQDFSSPYNTGDIVPGSENSFYNNNNKRDLMQEIEVRQNGGGPDEAPVTTMGCEEMKKLAQEKVDAGEAASLDDFCAEFKSKARCSVTGAVIDKKDVDEILASKSGKEYSI